MRIPQRNIWRLLRIFLATKARTKTFNCNSHKENCEDFLIFDWDLGKVEEHFPFSAQTCDYFITTSWIHEACHLLNLFKIPLQIYYRNMKVNNLSKSPSLTLFFYLKIVFEVSFKGCYSYIFASLFSKSKGEDFWNKEKYFYFISKAFLR